MPATDHYWRPLSTMHKVFAFSAVALLACTILMMSKDHQDEWREYQTLADEYKTTKLRQELDSATGGEYASQLEDLVAQRKAAEADVAQHTGEIDELQSQISTLQGAVDLRARETKFKGAERDVARANYDIGVRDSVPEDELSRLKTAYDARQSEYNQLSLHLSKEQAELADAKGQLATLLAERSELDNELKTLQTDSDRINKSLASISPSGPL